MELSIQKTYSDFKQELDTELAKSAEGFVRIGYLLKIARDTDILAESGYANVNDFAAAEYGLDKSQVSRFININDRFSEGGYSEHLESQYKTYGYAKLAMMLTLPDVVIEELTPAYSKAEIQAIKEEMDAEAAITPIETYLEGEKEEQQSLPTTLDKVLNQLFHDDPKLFSFLHHQIKYGGEKEDIKDAIAPSGDSFHSVRIQGVGRKFLTTKENLEDIAITDARNGEKEYFKWDDIARICTALVNTETDAKENWEQIYEEPYPLEEKKPEVAPVQPPSAPPKDTKPAPAKKKSKVTKAKIAKKPEKLRADKVLTEDKNEPLEGQKTIENYPEVLPTAQNETENSQNDTPDAENDTLIAENDTPVAAVETLETGINPKADAGLRVSEGQRKAYVEDIEYRLDEIRRLTESGIYEAARTHANKITEILDKLIMIQEDED